VALDIPRFIFINDHCRFVPSSLEKEMVISNTSRNHLCGRVYGQFCYGGWSHVLQTEQIVDGSCYKQ
jgi:hypothetical protein